MTEPGDAAVGDSRTDGSFDVSPAAARRRDERTAALSFLDAAIARLDADASSQATARDRDVAEHRSEATR